MKKYKIYCYLKQCVVKYAIKIDYNIISLMKLKSLIG